MLEIHLLIWQEHRYVTLKIISPSTLNQHDNKLWIAGIIVALKKSILKCLHGLFIVVLLMQLWVRKVISCE